MKWFRRWSKCPACNHVLSLGLRRWQVVGGELHKGGTRIYAVTTEGGYRNFVVECHGMVVGVSRAVRNHLDGKYCGTEPAKMESIYADILRRAKKAGDT